MPYSQDTQDNRRTAAGTAEYLSASLLLHPPAQVPRDDPVRSRHKRLSTSPLQIPIAKLLHGEQSFSFHKPACAGDTVTVRSTVSDIYDKKNGALEFVVKLSRATNQRDELVAELRSVLVCKN